MTESSTQRSQIAADRPVVSGGVGALTALASVAVIGVYVRALFFTPLEINQGAAQKILYLHVPAAWVALLAGLLVAATALGYLWLRDPRLDRISASAAEVGLLFTTVTLMTGVLWARPVWGTWWQWWDLRLDLTLFYWFLLVAYVVQRGLIDNHDMRARYSAVLGVLGALLVPFIHLSVYLVTTLHPRPFLLRPEGPGDSLPSSMLQTWLLGFAAFLLLFTAFVRLRSRLAETTDALDAAGGA